MNGPIRRTALGLLAAFALLALDLTYWQIQAADRLRVHPDNPRSLIAGAGRERGQIISSDTAVLATSVPDPSDPRRYARSYPYGGLYAHTVGFSSRLLGDSGVEASHASVLSSEQNLTVTGIINRMLGEDLGPRSVQITLNHRLQQMAQRALGNRRGAVVAVEPSTGRLLAMVSSPSFDPNALVGMGAGEEWEALLGGSGRALLNRATGGFLPEEFLSEGAPTEGFLDSSPSDGPTRPLTALPIGLWMSTIAGGGILMEPHIAARVFDAASNLWSEFEPVPLAGRITAEDARTVREGMDPLVIPTDNLGALAGLGVTGSGLTPTGEPAVWFAGFSPVGQPAIAVAVVIESLNPVSGSGMGVAEAASIGRAVMREWLDEQ